MKWKAQSNGVVTDENQNPVCVFLDQADSFSKAIIRYAPEMFDAILDYAQSMENATSPRNPKKHYDRFQRILEFITEAGNQ